MRSTTRQPRLRRLAFRWSEIVGDNPAVILNRNFTPIGFGLFTASIPFTTALNYDATENEQQTKAATWEVFQLVRRRGQ